MREYTQMEQTVEVLNKVKCDVCGKEYDVKDMEDSMEVQEFTHIGFVGGYSSIFGDCVNVSCDICQHCLDKKLGNFLKFN